MAIADEIQEEAWRIFEQWRAENDPDGELDLIEAIHAYYEAVRTDTQQLKQDGK